MKFLNTLLISLVMLTSSISTVNATLIQVNDNLEVEALTLTESFINFYDYNTNKWSSNTGYEQNNTIVMFFAEYNNELALFTLADSFGQGSAGTATIAINNINDFGTILFKDDAGDATTSNGVAWKWSAGKNDGFIFTLNNPSDFYLDIQFSNLSGVGKGIKFLSFSDQNSPTEHEMKSNLTAKKVPEPSTLAIFGLALIGLASRQFKK